MAKLISLNSFEEVSFTGRFSDGSDRVEQRKTVHEAVVVSDGERHTLRFEGAEPTLQQIADAIPLPVDLPPRTDGKKDADQRLAEIATKVEAIDAKVPVVKP